MATTLTDEVRTMLTEGTNFAALSTVRADGASQTSLVWIDAEGDNIVFNTAEGRLKTKHLRRDPRVSLCVFDPANPYRQALIRGRVVDITPEGADDHIDSLAKRYLGQDKYPFRAPGEERLIVRIAPERVGMMG